MQKEEIQGLVHKYLNDTASPQEEELLLQWYRAAQGKDIEWLATVKDEEQLLKASMFEYIKNQPGMETLSRSSRKLWPRIAAVSMAWKIAAAVAVITLGVWLYNISNTPRHPELVSGSPLANDIAPGKQGATLTLADGKVIQLSDAKTGVVIGTDKLAYNDGTDLTGRHPEFNPEFSSGSGSRTREATMTASTTKGQTYQVTLSDGTKVWLNADSKISFPSQFSGKQRKILLSGEAYFEVAKDAKRPFIVQSAGQEVTVLGTHFNISAYQDEGIRTTLLEGSVKVASILSPPRGEPSLRAQRGQKKLDASSYMFAGQRGEEKILKPNQQSLITANNNITVKQVDAEETIAWKNGKFGFNSEEMGSVMRKVARWYNVEVIFKDQALLTEKVSGSVSRFANISTLLNMLEETGGTHFKIEGRKVYVTR